MDRQILTLDEAAALLRVSRRTLQQMALDGTVPGRHVGRQWRFHRRSLEDFVARGDPRGRDVDHATP